MALVEAMISRKLVDEHFISFSSMIPSRFRSIVAETKLQTAVNSTRDLYKS